MRRRHEKNGNTQDIQEKGDNRKNMVNLEGELHGHQDHFQEGQIYGQQAMLDRSIILRDLKT